jgi:ribosomal protein S18 acetylase RimI-like enzyme
MGNKLLEIRPLIESDDLNDLISLSREFFEEYESHHEDFFKIDNLSEINIVNYFTRWLDNEDGKALIALSDGKLVGYITVYVKSQENFWKVKKVGTISGLMIDKAYRRKGIAKQLLDGAKDFFNEKGVRYFTVYTSEDNVGAIEFYKKNGLSPINITLLGKLSSF